MNKIFVKGNDATMSLPGGALTLFSARHVKRVEEHDWICQPEGRLKIIISVPKNKRSPAYSEIFHRFLLENPPVCVRHSGSYLDNRDESLIKINLGKPQDCNPFPGVIWDKKHFMWEVHVWEKGLKRLVAYTDNAEEAAIIYTRAAVNFGVLST